MDGKLFIDGQWVETDSTDNITNKYTGETVGTVPLARAKDTDAAIEAAHRAAGVMAEWPAHRRSQLLLKTAEGLQDQAESLAQIIAAEAGKSIAYARGEVGRAVNTFTWAGEEAKRIHGETVPLDAVPSGDKHFGFWQRRPLGVVGAITPFNFPLNLVAHKVAPALAAGNAVVLKPAEVTPLCAVMLCKIMESAGLPAGAVNLVHGPGEVVGHQIVTDPRVQKITFTGSREVGHHITQHAGIKKVTLELGNTAPVIICDDADLDAAAQRCALGAFYYSGQVCISTQRIYAHPSIRDEFIERLIAATGEIGVGDPMDASTVVGPLISQSEAERVESWVTQATASGAKVLVGAERNGAMVQPTVLTNVSHDMKVVRDEVFGPVCNVLEANSFEEALALADNTSHGLQAAVFTQNINRIFDATRRLNFGGVVINDAPSFRADHMPYGGNRQSGLGREGLKFAIEEMTNIQMVVVRLRD